MEIITVALQSIKILVCISQMFHKIHGQSKNATKHFEVVDAGTRNCNFKHYWIKKCQRYLCLTHQIRIYIRWFNQQTFFCSLCRNPKAQLLLTRITKFRLKLMQLLWVLSSGVFRLYPSSRGSRTIYKMAIMTTESMAYFKTMSFVEDVDAKCQVFDTSSTWISSILAGEAVSDFLLHAPKSQRLKLKN